MVEELIKQKTEERVDRVRTDLERSIIPSLDPLEQMRESFRIPHQR